jgi:hypothetical protein
MELVEMDYIVPTRVCIQRCRIWSLPCEDAHVWRPNNSLKVKGVSRVLATQKPSRIQP